MVNSNPEANINIFMTVCDHAGFDEIKFGFTNGSRRLKKLERFREAIIEITSKGY